MLDPTSPLDESASERDLSSFYLHTCPRTKYLFDSFVKFLIVGSLSVMSVLQDVVEPITTSKMSSCKTKSSLEDFHVLLSVSSRGDFIRAGEWSDTNRSQIDPLESHQCQAIFCFSKKKTLEVSAKVLTFHLTPVRLRIGAEAER